VLHAHPIRAVSISADGSKVATADDSGGVRLWSADGAPIASRSSPLYGPRGLAFSDGGRFLAASGRDPALSVMDTAGGLFATTIAKPSDLDAVSRARASSSRSRGDRIDCAPGTRPATSVRRSNRTRLTRSGSTRRVRWSRFVSFTSAIVRR
jgi:WD40 repeat protein